MGEGKKSEMIRRKKLEDFVMKKVQLMENQQRIIEHGKANGLPGTEIIEYNQIATYNYTFDLCREIDMEMPHVLGVTPKTTSY